MTDPEQENENQDQAVNGNVDPDNLVNEISKQQIVIQYLKVKLHSLTLFFCSSVSCEIVNESIPIIMYSILFNYETYYNNYSFPSCYVFCNQITCRKAAAKP